MTKYYAYCAGALDIESMLDVIEKHSRFCFDSVKELLDKILQTPRNERDELFSDSEQRIDEYTVLYEYVNTFEDDDGGISISYLENYQWSDDDSYDDNEESTSLYFALEPPKDFEYEVVEV